ncbi:MAG: hypothetical protein AB7H71_13970 [Alphaproteobacteria bacterium]
MWQGISVSFTSFAAARLCKLTLLGVAAVAVIVVMRPKRAH